MSAPHVVAMLYDQLEEGGHVAPGVDRDTATRVIAAALAGEVGARSLGDCRNGLGYVLGRDEVRALLEGGYGV